MDVALLPEAVTSCVMDTLQGVVPSVVCSDPSVLCSWRRSVTGGFESPTVQLKLWHYHHGEQLLMAQYCMQDDLLRGNICNKIHTAIFLTNGLRIIYHLPWPTSVPSSCVPEMGSEICAFLSPSNYT